MFHHRGVIVWSMVHKRTENSRYASGRSKKFRVQIQTDEEKHRHGRINNHSLRWHRTEPHPQRRHETTFPRKHIHFWNPSSRAPGRYMKRKNVSVSSQQESGKILNCPVIGIHIFKLLKFQSKIFRYPWIVRSVNTQKNQTKQNKNLRIN